MQLKNAFFFFVAAMGVVASPIESDVNDIAARDDAGDAQISVTYHGVSSGRQIPLFQWLLTACVEVRQEERYLQVQGPKRPYHHHKVLYQPCRQLQGKFYPRWRFAFCADGFLIMQCTKDKNDCTYDSYDRITKCT